jgi:hypothetical protein
MTKTTDEIPRSSLIEYPPDNIPIITDIPQKRKPEIIWISVILSSFVEYPMIISHPNIPNDGS